MTDGRDMIRVFLVEDHPLMRAVLRDLVAGEPEMEVVGVAASAEDSRSMIAEALPDLVLIDLSLPGMSGDRLVTLLRDEHPAMKTLIVSGHEEELYAGAAERAGAGGYVMKDDPGRILEAIRTVARGERFPSQPRPR